jgi:carbon storage regulator
MLVLTRKQGEEVVIGEVRVIVAEVRGNEVRLGVTAPPHVTILREELRRDDQGRRVPGREPG